MTRDNDIVSMIRVLEGKVQALDAKMDLLLAQTKPRESTWRDFVKGVQENMVKSGWKHPVTGRPAMYRDALKQANSMKERPERDLEEPVESVPINALAAPVEVPEPLPVTAAVLPVTEAVLPVSAAVLPVTNPVLPLAKTVRPPVPFRREQFTYAQRRIKSSF